MYFYIPPELKQVESHLSWIEQIIPYLERSMLDKSETLEEHIRSLEKKTVDEEDNDGDVAIVTDENFEDGYNEHNPKYCNVYASRLNEATKLAVLFEFDEALDQLQLLKRIYDKVELCHREAFKYTVDALEWSIKVWKNLRSSENSTEEVEKAPPEIVEDPVLFQSRWEELRGDDKAKAVLKFLWGCLGGTLKISEEVLLPLHQEVLSLDPDYHVWYSLVYRTMRGMRRNFLRQQSGILNKPSHLEQLMCKEAYDRKPDIYLSIKDMAIMLKETLWGGSQEDWDREEATYLRCQQLFEEALKIATERNQKKWMKKIQVYLAEFLLFGSGSLLDQTEGKRIFDKCLEENPKDTTVLHKVGKLCHYGAANKLPDKIRRYRNWDLAEQFYYHAVTEKSSNFPCLKDYLKLLKSRQKYAEYVEVLDTHINYMKRDYQVSDLKIARGCVVWIFNPFRDRNNKEDACDSWLYVLAKLPDFSENLYSAIFEPPFHTGKNQRAYINLPQLISTLERLRKTCPHNDEERMSAIRTFLHKIRAARAQAN